MRTEFRLLPIYFHQKLELTLILRSGQDAAFLEFMMGMVDRYVLTFWEIICTHLWLMKFASQKIQLRLLNKALQKLKRHSSRKSTTQKPILSKTKVAAAPSWFSSSKTFATAPTSATAELFWVLILAKMLFLLVLIISLAMIKKHRELKMEAEKSTTEPPPTKSSLTTKTTKTTNTKNWT